MPENEENNAGETPTIESLTAELAAAKADSDKWQALSKKNEARAKENAEKALKFDEHETASLTEIEKANKRAEAAEKRLADIDAAETSKKLIEEVAKAKGFDERKISASALRGSTREELEAHADELLALIPAPPAAPSADGQGATGDVIGDGEMSSEEVVAAAIGR